MNPHTNQFDSLDDAISASDVDKARENYQAAAQKLLAQEKMAALAIEPDKPFQPIWTVGERVEVNGYFFEVMDIGKDRVTLKPVGLVYTGTFLLALSNDATDKPAGEQSGFGFDKPGGGK